MSFDLFFLSSESIIEGKSKLNVVNFLPNQRRNITHVSETTISQHFEVEWDDSKFVKDEVCWIIKFQHFIFEVVYLHCCSKFEPQYLYTHFNRKNRNYFVLDDLRWFETAITCCSFGKTFERSCCVVELFYLFAIDFETIAINHNPLMFAK